MFTVGSNNPNFILHFYIRSNYVIKVSPFIYWGVKGYQVILNGPAWSVVSIFYLHS